MKQYEVNHPDTIESSGFYDWEESLNSEFTKELKQIGLIELGRDIKMTWFRLFEITVFFAVAMW